jgi:cytochrome c oxidase subunit II
MLRKALRLFSLALLTMSGFSIQAAEQEASSTTVLNMPTGVSTISHQIYDLHMLIFWVCVIIGIGVFGAMLWAMYFHRKSIGHEAENWHEHLGVELVWTIVPIFILVAMAWPATTTLIEIYDTSDAEIDIRVTGSQWKWQYEYMGEGVQFLSQLASTQDEIYNLDEKGEFYLQEVDNPLVIPVDTKVRFLLSATDVIHSFWVPDFAIKKDAIPGYITETWVEVTETGVYRGSCTELCGQGHAFMPVVFNVVEKDEYEFWLAEKIQEAEALAALTEQTFTMEELMARGEEAYLTSCALCHQANGQGVPPAFPSLVGSAVVTGPIDAHLEVGVNGVPGTVMQAFGNLLSEVDLAAIMTYQRNAWGNDMGDLVQPIDVYNYKQGQ